MKNEEIDQLIKDALSKEEAAYYTELEEQNVPQMLGGLFKGKLGWFAFLTVGISFSFFILGIYCLLQFLEAETTKSMIKWAAGMFFCLNVTTMMKIWHWMQIQKNAIFRELKRVELQLSALTKSKE